MDSEAVSIVFPLATTVALLILGYVAGTVAERRHYASIRQREQELVGFPALTFKSLPPGWSPTRCGLVVGCVVVSPDYFKRFLAGLRNLIGGRLGAYESLLERGRREAILRVKEDARRRNFQAVINLRLETSSISSARQDGKGTTGVEVIAYGTAIDVPELRRPGAPAAAP
jgi:uncharacterized protein YbjQ (UPF0145 family)